MKQSEIIFNELTAMGFEPVKLGDAGYIFSYEKLAFLYMVDDDDENFLRIAVPHIFEVTDENRGEVLEAINATAELLKYSKVFIMYETAAWAFYEHRLFSYDHLPELLEHIIQTLEVTTHLFLSKMNGEDIRPNPEKREENFDDIIDEEFEKNL